MAGASHNVAENILPGCQFCSEKASDELIVIILHLLSFCAFFYNLPRAICSYRCNFENK